MDSSPSWFRRVFQKKPQTPRPQQNGEDEATLLQYGVTEQLRDFVKGFTLETFKDFQIQNPGVTVDDGYLPTTSSRNVRQDLTEWQERHAMLVLSAVKEISFLRYVLCPRHMKEQQFWRIYFMLVKSYIAPYEMRAIHDAKLKIMKMADAKLMDRSAIEVEMTEATHAMDLDPVSSEQDIDTLSLGGYASTDLGTGEIAVASGSGDDVTRKIVAEPNPD